MHLVIVGVNYNTAPIQIRERLAIDEGGLVDALEKIREDAHILEACIVSTCNRTEVYAVTQSRADDELLIDFLADYCEISKEKLDCCIYKKPGHHAVKHLFEVVSGLDSMALGETQVQGQIRNAYCIADDSGYTGKILNNLFQQAIGVGKRARNETNISRGAFSIGAAAAQLAKFVFVNLSGRKVLLLGAGEMSKLAANHLRANGVGRIVISNRTRANAERLSKELKADVVDFDSFQDALAEVDLVISSTAAPKPIITADLVRAVMSKRGHSPIFLVDIAVPRDVEPEVASIDGVFVYNIDDLECIVDSCRSEREAEVEKVREIVDEETADFMAYMRTLEAVPLIKQLREKFESVYIAEWERCSKKLGHLSFEDKEKVRRSIKSAVKRLTHDPILRMKDYAANGGSDKLDIARELFGLSPDAGQCGQVKGPIKEEPNKKLSASAGRSKKKYTAKAK